MTDEINIYNIPAFKRKRSIAAKARKKPNYNIKTNKTKKTLKKSGPKELDEIAGQNTFPSEDVFNEQNLKYKEKETREMQKCGICEGYFDKINVAIIKITSPLREGDQIIFEIENGLFEQKVKSMQINKKTVSLARTGSDIGLKAIKQPIVGTPVYKVI